MIVRSTFSAIAMLFTMLVYGQQDLVPREGVLDPEIYGSSRKNAIYGEIGGSGFLLSVSYERKLVDEDKLELNARIGFGSALLLSAVPLAGLNLCVGSSNSKFEIGFNAVRTYALDLFFADNTTYILGNPVVGYRYISDKGLLFRLTASPFFALSDPDDWIDEAFVFPWAGLSLGYSF